MNRFFVALYNKLDKERRDKINFLIHKNICSFTWGEYFFGFYDNQTDVGTVVIAPTKNKISSKNTESMNMNNLDFIIDTVISCLN